MDDLSDRTEEISNVGHIDLFTVLKRTARGSKTPWMKCCSK